MAWVGRGARALVLLADGGGGAWGRPAKRDACPPCVFSRAVCLSRAGQGGAAVLGTAGFGWLMRLAEGVARGRAELLCPARLAAAKLSAPQLCCCQAVCLSV